MGKTFMPRSQRPSTRIKRNVAKTTGIPTTSTGRKRKAYNKATSGLYGEYERERAKYNPRGSSDYDSDGCGCFAFICFVVILIIIYHSVFG